MAKYYFRKYDENCYKIEAHLNYMEKHNIDEMEVFEAKIIKESNQIKVEIYKRSEDYEVIGMYYINEDKFKKSSHFWENMFTEHLLF